VRRLAELLLVFLAGLLPALFANRHDRKRAYAFILISNLVPVVGVVFFGWSVFSLIMLYWFESLAVGLFNLLAMLTAGAFGSTKGFSILGCLGGFFSGLFFTVHYGSFMFVHGVFLMAGGRFFDFMRFPVEDASPDTLLLGIFREGLEYLSRALSSPGAYLTSEVFALTLIFLSLAWQFVSEFLREKQYIQKDPMDLMARPYPRVILMHLTILFGALPVLLLKLPAVVMVLFMAIKTTVDLRQYNKQAAQVAVEKAAAASGDTTSNA
jgi:hypothetical protein